MGEQQSPISVEVFEATDPEHCLGIFNFVFRPISGDHIEIWRLAGPPGYYEVVEIRHVCAEKELLETSSWERTKPELRVFVRYLGDVPGVTWA